MLQKNGKWYADWRDSAQKRCRKAFATRRMALSYQTRMRGKAQEEGEKKAHASARYGRSRKATPRPSSAARTRK